MTAPGAPYQFPQSSDSSASTIASYAFSSLSTTPASSVSTETSAAATTSHQNRVRSPQSSQNKPPSQNKPRFVGYPSTSTTSAAVRLTDRAKAKDVTALLRGKFGLPPISINVSSTDKNISHMQQVHHVYASAQINSSRKLSSHLSQYQKKDIGKSNISYPSTMSTTNKPAENEDEVDVLVLVGTLERPPKGYIRFEHEEILEEQRRLEAFRHFKRTHPSTGGVFDTNRTNRQQLEARVARARMSVSESADTIRASGGEKGFFSSTVLATSSDHFPSGAQAIGHSFNSDDDLPNVAGPSTSAIGLDLSSSRCSTAAQTTPWGSFSGVGINDSVRNTDCRFPAMQPATGAGNPEIATPSNSEPDLQATLKTSNYRLRNMPLEYEYDSEPIHIVRTVQPDEHPLQVRDDMMQVLVKLRRKAEDEMGLRLHLNEERSESLIAQQLCQPTFRWFFQPCSALGGSGTSSSSSKIQSIPSYIDLEGYCTGDNESDSDDTYSDDSTDDGRADESKVDFPFSPAMNRLARERRHIAVLRDLSDPTFIVSGYLLKQSSRDPNVWRRVYCVLGEDRLWTIRRMKTLTRSTDPFRVALRGNEDVLSSLRIGRHSYIKLHRSLLLEDGDGTLDLKQSNRQFVSPLGRRLPNTFRILPANASSHTFRAFNSPSFRVWSSSLAEKITLLHGDGLIDLANVIAEEESLARCKRHEDVSVLSLLNKMKLPAQDLSAFELVNRFGASVAEFKELCRHVTNAIQPQVYHGVVLNLQTKVGGPHSKPRTQHGQSDSLNLTHHEYIAIVSAVWEDARVVASKSAQLLHAFAAKQYVISDEDCNTHKDDDLSALMDNLLKEQKEVQTILDKQWDIIISPSHQQSDNKTDAASSEVDELALPPLNLFDTLLGNFQAICVTIMV
ncbi:hypothetical protein ACHAW6_006582 [Cyclotella cf. meneghiniana]